MLLPVDGLTEGEADDADCVGDVVGDGETETEGDGDVDVDDEPLDDAVGVGVGVGVGNRTAPPTATPLTQVYTYSIPGGLGRTMDGDGFGGGLEDGGAGGEVDGVTLTVAVLEIVGVGSAGDGGRETSGGVGFGVGVWAAKLAEAADADCAATCLLTTVCVVIRPWLPLTSRPTRSTAVNVTAVIRTHESSQPSAKVSGRPGRRQPPSAAALATPAAIRRHHGR